MESFKEKLIAWFDTTGRMNRAAFVKRFFGVNLACMAGVLMLGSRLLEATGSVTASNLVSGALAALAAVTLLFIVLIFHAGEPRRNVYGAVPGRAAAPRAERKRLGRKARSV